MAKVLKCVGWGCQGPASRWRCSYSIAAELRDGGGGWGLRILRFYFQRPGSPTESLWMESWMLAGIDATLIALHYISVCEALV